MSTHKTCRLCHTEKPLDEFYYRKDSNKYRSECKDCLIELVKYREYGVCKVKYEELLLAQGGSCAICKTKFSNSRYNKLSIDHCHTTGKVRGLLCNNCNTAIGLLKESIHRLEAAKEYLQRFDRKDIV